MKKEIRLALLGISLALGSSTVVLAIGQPGITDRIEGQATKVAALTREDIRKIRECVVNRDILCLRSVLVRNPNLLQQNTALSRALLNFANVTDATSARDLFSEIQPVIEDANSIYS